MQFQPIRLLKKMLSKRCYISKFVCFVVNIIFVILETVTFTTKETLMP